MDRLPRELLEKIILLAGPGCVAVSRSFRDVVLANVRSARYVMHDLPPMPNLRALHVLSLDVQVPRSVTRLDVSMAAKCTGGFNARHSLTVRGDQLPAVRYKEVVVDLTVRRFCPAVTGFANLRSLEVDVLTGSHIGRLPLAGLEKLTLGSFGDWASGDWLADLAACTALKSLVLRGVREGPLGLEHVPKSVSSLRMADVWWTDPQATEIAVLELLPRLKDVTVPTVPVSWVPERVRPIVANTVTDGFYVGEHFEISRSALTSTVLTQAP